MPTFFCAFLLALALFVQLPVAVKTTMNSSFAAPVIAEATRQPGSPLTTFGRLGQSIGRRLPVVRWLRAIRRATRQRQSGAENAGAPAYQLLGVQSDLAAQPAAPTAIARVSVLGAEIGLQHRFLPAGPRRWRRVAAPRWARQALLSHDSAAFSEAPEQQPTGRGYPQLTALWVRGAGWGVTVYWSGAGGSRQRLRAEKRSRVRQWIINWQRA